MSRERCVGFVIVGEVVTVVDAEIPDDPDEPLTIISDDTWRLQNGERAPAYAVLHQRCADYLRENGVRSVAVKASAISARQPARLALLMSAEVRGIIIAAAASVCEVSVVPKALISRTYGERKVDEYIEDDDFWNNQTQGGRLRKMSREAAMQVIATRNR
jgi:hypothetical protein